MTGLIRANMADRVGNPDLRDEAATTANRIEIARDLLASVDPGSETARLLRDYIAEEESA
jgi:hypothetical protein